MKLKYKISFLILFLLVLFVSIGCPPNSTDIDIEICLNNPQPTTAREDCPETEVRKYPQGTTFLVCTLDHSVPIPPEPPIPPIPPIPPQPPIPEPAPPYIGGSYYQLITESNESIKWYFEELKNNGGNATEIFLTFTWSNGWKNSPFKQVGEWSEEKYGDYKFPMFDLNQWNDETWSKFLLICNEAKENGIALFIRIQDYCSVKDPFEKRHYPFSNGSNVQNYTGGMWGEPIRHWYRNLNEKVIEYVNASGLKHYFIVPMNEADVVGDDWSGGESEKDQVCKDFHQFYIDDFQNRGVKKDQFILNIFRDNTREHFEDADYRIEWHWIASLQSLRARHNESGLKIFPNGDGATDGQGIQSGNYREPSYAQAIEMGNRLKDKFGYCYFLRSTEQGSIGDVTKANFIALNGLAEGLKK